jgi:hypothetical protein
MARDVTLIFALLAQINGLDALDTFSTPIDPDKDTVTRDDADTCNAALNALQCSEWAAANGFTFGGTVHTAVAPAGCYRVLVASSGNVVFNTYEASTVTCNAASVEYCVCARYKVWMLPRDRCGGSGALGKYPYNSRAEANQACLDFGCTGLADSNLLDEPEFSFQLSGGTYTTSGHRCRAAWYLRYHAGGANDNQGIWWMDPSLPTESGCGSGGYWSYGASEGDAACTGCPQDTNICSPSPSPPPPAPIQPLEIYPTGIFGGGYCARGSITVAECRTRAGANPFSSGTFSSRPGGCYRYTSFVGTAQYYYNYNPTPSACSPSYRCLCKATDLHALADLSFQTTLTVAANTRTRIYHKHLNDGGILEAGDLVRYVPANLLTDGSTACSVWSGYAFDDPDTAGMAFGGALQGDNGIYVDVNLADTDGSNTEIDYEFCYVKTYSRRKLQIIGNPELRGGGLLIVQAPSPPPAPPPYASRTFKPHTHTSLHAPLSLHDTHSRSLSHTLLGIGVWWLGLIPECGSGQVRRTRWCKQWIHRFKLLRLDQFL